MTSSAEDTTTVMGQARASVVRKPSPNDVLERGPSAAAVEPGPRGWKRRLEDPTNTYYRYRVARPIARVLAHTWITPNQVSFVQPLLAALAGWLVTFDDYRHVALGALCFELRSVLDCVDGSLAREKKCSSPAGHAIDAVCDWLGVILLYAGIFWHFRLHPPPPGPWSSSFNVPAVLCLVLAQAALRSFASDYFKTKYVSIFERGRDDTVDALRTKLGALGARPSLFARLDVGIGRLGHLFFEHEWFDPARPAGPHEAQVKEIARREGSPFARFLGALWAVSNGDAFLTLVVASMLVNQLWLGQVFFATVGWAWTLAVLVLNGWFIKSRSEPRLARA
ncbi:MAG TPA: CDP-alcohol phosphatidyltransferase family protein [Minicystis sp.]|nr:CDP-alcohol phosphatidyltransferase family protein [Minicystis sp.]